MAKQSLIWTTLPNGLTADGDLKVSAMLSPRLDPDGDPLRLDSFAEWLDWPGTLEKASFEIRYGADTLTIAATQTEGAARVDDALGLPDSVAWKALFPPDLFVRPHEFKDLVGHQVISYDAAAIDGLVRNLYGKLAAQANGDMPLASDFIDDPAWQDLVTSVAILDSLTVSEDTGLRDPNLIFEEKRQSHGTANTLEKLAAFQAFHTPAANPKVVELARRDDPRITARWLEYQQTKLPDEQDIAKEIDFHQIVAAMNQYPTLLRRLGIVVDFIVPAETFNAAADKDLSVSVSFEGPLPTPTSGVDPLTHTELSSTVFRAVPNPTPPSPDELRIVDGLLDIDPKRFALLQSDVDAAGSKLMGFARSLARLAQGDTRVDPVTRHEKQTGAPSLRTAGLMLVQRARGSALEQRFSTNALKNTAAEGVLKNLPGATPPDLYAEDLVRGFRFDIWDGTTRVWRSLFQRTATYDLDKGAVVIKPEEPEEGTSRLAATRSPDPTSNPGRLWLHEALVSWSGWSLAASQPGRAIMPDDQPDTADRTEAEVPPGIPLKTTFNALRGSLPRLRFGRDYWMRGRVVDLAGNSPAPQEGDFGSEHPEDHARPYLRYEPIAAPVLALREDGDGNIEAPEEGESMSHIAIRSFNDTPPDNNFSTVDQAHRVAVPPQASVRDAEQHGMLDSGGKVDKSTFTMLALEKDKDARQPGAAPREELLPMQGPLDPTPVDTTFSVFPDDRELTYLPDPLAVEVAARVFRHPNIADIEVIPIPLYPSSSWPNATPFKIKVYEDDVAPPKYDPATHTLLVPLPKAVRARVRISMKPSADALRTLGVWRWLSATQRATLEQTALDGQHWMLTPWNNIDVVHAVQRPLIEPEIIDHVIQRPLRATHAVPRLTATCSLKSTDKLDLVAQWHEPNDDPSAVGSEAIAADKTLGDIAYTVKVTSKEDYATKLDGHARGGFPDHSIIGDDEIGVGMPGDDRLKPKRHEFHDTRYRRIEYFLEATSRFREYMPKDVLTKPSANGPVPTDEKIKVIGPKLVTWIPSSAPPPAPDVVYVVPTFGWVRTTDDQGNERRWRRGGGLRVYLDRPWMATGYGEMLAVVLPSASFTGEPENEPAGDPLKKYVTQWGNDPIWKSPFVAGVAPKRANFPRARTAADPTGSWLPANAPEAEKEQPPVPFEDTNLVPPGVRGGQTTVEVAPHDVHYDDKRRLWYCDIEIDQGGSYFPFIRLGLARYQPVSTRGAHLSSVVLADFMPLAPHRWLNVNQTDDPVKRRVIVHGHGYSGSSGHDEAESAPSMSIVNPITGEGRTMVPAEVAAKNVVEVWVERLDPERGEDFGWQRVDDAVVSPDKPHTGLDRLARFVPADRQMRAVRLQQERKYDVLLRENLAEKLFYVVPLWAGEVTLPEEPGGDSRYRLVIAEYEEYLVDDDRPYDRVPEAKDRRLVFVEHVELE